jgi:threonine dehydratase
MMRNAAADTAMSLPTCNDVRAAAERIKAAAYVTPLLRCAALDQLTDATVLLKAESLQRTGSFKIRGAFNRLCQLNDRERRAGVVAWSSGNHAQGVAAAAKQLNISATIVMPADAPAIKSNNVRALGAEIVAYDRANEDREIIARRIAEERGAIIVPSYDDPHIIAGQGTVGLELMDQARDMGLEVDDILVPVSGGGLIAGIGLAARAANPAVKLYGAEPKGFDDHCRSLASGQRERNTSSANALCDALLAPSPGALTWAINAEGMAGCYAVDDELITNAVIFAFKILKLVLEPSGSAALAALLGNLHGATGRTVAVVLSGGNVDTETFSACLGRAL